MNDISEKNTFLILKDIRFWIVFFFIIRLYGITNPPLEVSHNWRQVASIAVAKNFYEIDNSIFFPRVDELKVGSGTGIISMEFPAQNYVMYLCYKLFGYADWYGRLITLIISSIGIYFFYKSIYLYFDKKTAFISAITLTCSVYFIFSRKTMPDTFSVSLIFIGIYYGLSYFKSKRILHLSLFIVFGLLGALSKIPAFFLLSVFAIPIFSSKLKQSIPIILGLLLITSCVVWWYYYWDLQLRLHFEQSLWMERNKNLWEGFLVLFNNYDKVLKNFYFHALSYSGFILFCTGVVLAFINKNKLLISVFFTLSFSFFIFMLKAERYFYVHNYYVIPYVSVMCLFVAYTFSHIKNKKIIITLLSFIVLENILNQQHDFRIKESELYKTTLTDITQQYVPKTATVAVNGDLNPQLLFFSYRRGYTFETQSFFELDLLNKLKNNRINYVIIDKHTCTQTLPLTIVFQNPDFVIYRV